MLSDRQGQQTFNQFANFVMPSQDSNSEKGVDISFQNLSYSVKISDKEQSSFLPCRSKYQEKTILYEMQGIFKASTVNVIMGSSGAGKTTFLNILTCRKQGNKGTQLMANKTTYGESNFGDFASYVMQQNILMETFTVRETLQFSAKMKLKVPQVQKKQIISQLIKQLNLEKCLDTFVGGKMLKGISGGEMKRLSIAVQLISDSDVLFLDEPTSGLDSLTSFVTVSYLRRLSRTKHKTIIMSIHQPNQETFKLFDNLTLLAQGRIIYQGKAIEATQYFQENFQFQLPQFMNPSEFIISKTHYGTVQNRKHFPSYFQAYTLRIQPEIVKKIENRNRVQVVQKTQIVGAFAKIMALIQRNYLSLVRNPHLLRNKLFLRPFTGLFVGGLFFAAGQRNYNEAQGFYTIAGFLFFMTISALLSSLGPNAFVFPVQKVLLFKEQTSRMYTISHYFIAKSIFEIPEQMITPLLTFPIYYWMVGLSSTLEQILTHFLIYYFIGFAGLSIGYIIGAIILDEKNTTSAAIVTVFPLIIFSGFFKNRDQLPGWASWIEYISPNTYAFSAFLQNQTAERSSMVDSLNFQFGTWPSIGLLVIIGLAYRIIALICLSYFKKQIKY